MLPLRRLPVGIPLHYRCVGHLQLHRHELHHRPRHIQRIRQKPTQEPHRPQLRRETQPVVLTTAPGDLLPIGVIKEEEPLQLRPRRVTHEPPERGHLIVAEELHRHG